MILISQGLSWILDSLKTRGGPGEEGPPRSRMRERAPVRLSRWKLMSRSSTWLNVWYATRRPAACYHPPEIIPPPPQSTRQFPQPHYPQISSLTLAVHKKNYLTLTLQNENYPVLATTRTTSPSLSKIKLLHPYHQRKLLTPLSTTQINPAAMGIAEPLRRPRQSPTPRLGIPRTVFGRISSPSTLQVRKEDSWGAAENATTPLPT